MKTPSEPATVMIVDDAPANLRQLTGLLKERGYRTRCLPTGELALRAIRKEAPDLLLLDINLPGISGFDIISQLKADSATRDIPVIFISILEDPREIVHAFKSGGVDYIRKPFHVEEVLARVETHLALRVLTSQLQECSRELIRLRSLLPLCAKCGQPRTDAAYQQTVRDYMDTHDASQFPQSICPDCNSNPITPPDERTKT